MTTTTVSTLNVSRHTVFEKDILTNKKLKIDTLNFSNDCIQRVSEFLAKPNPQIRLINVTMFSYVKGSTKLIRVYTAMFEWLLIILESLQPTNITCFINNVHLDQKESQGYLRLAFRKMILTGFTQSTFMDSYRLKCSHLMFDRDMKLNVAYKRRVDVMDEVRVFGDGTLYALLQYSNENVSLFLDQVGEFKQLGILFQPQDVQEWIEFGDELEQEQEMKDTFGYQLMTRVIALKKKKVLHFFSVIDSVNTSSFVCRPLCQQYGWKNDLWEKAGIH